MVFIFLNLLSFHLPKKKKKPYLINRFYCSLKIAFLFFISGMTVRRTVEVKITKKFKNIKI